MISLASIFVQIHVNFAILIFQSHLITAEVILIKQLQCVSIHTHTHTHTLMCVLLHLMRVDHDNRDCTEIITNVSNSLKKEKNMRMIST